MFAILGFYKFKKIINLNTKKKLLEKLFKIEKIRGSIILSKEGVNSTISFNNNQYDLINNHLKKILNIKNFDNENLSFCNYQAFHKGKIKIKKELVPIGIKLNKRISNNQIEPKKWNEFIKKKNTVLIDTRKGFQYIVGTFKGSINPKIKNFRDFPKFFKTLKKDNNIAMFCTGGIRCEKASAYLKHYGFEDVGQLHGGIIDYARQLEENRDLENKFKGKNFVFDERRGERVSSDIISNCHQCGNPCDTHVNCKNENCNLLFIQCSACQEIHENCCSVKCIEVSKLSDEERLKLRKGVENKKIFHSHKKVNLTMKQTE